MIPTREYAKNYLDIEWRDHSQPVRREEKRGRTVHYISDHMEPTVHMATGEVIDSKSKFRQRTREAGCEEVGNEKFPEREKPSRRELQADIRRTLEQLRSSR